MNDVERLLLTYLSGMAIVWLPVNVASWYLLFKRAGLGRWNWRVLVGPWVYCPWNDERRWDR